MVAFPIISAVLAALCALVIGRDAIRRPRPDKHAWVIAFVMFAIAAGADAAGRELGWSEWLARLYYMTGPALVVAFLAIGELCLLFASRMPRVTPGAIILLTAGWATLVLGAPIDEARLADEGWEAIDRSGALRVAAIAINSIGTLIIVGGLLWSIWRFQRTGRFRNRMIGCIFIVSGTIAVALGGTLTRLGHYEYLYVAMSVGIALIFAGVLWSRRPDRVGAGTTAGSNAGSAAARQGTEAVLPMSQEVAFLVEKVLPNEPEAIRGICLSWSVQASDDPVMSRRDARRAWRLRSHLPTMAQDRFDALSVSERRAVVELAAEVLQIPALTRVDDAHRPTADPVWLEG
ncbi:MAG TPA: hypothetical protein VGR22_02725 [Thermomicrobiales bacterium]|nr:hypothetical protein [Thermomicrobiales bacterium]